MLIALLQTLVLLITGRVRFPRQRIGETLVLADGRAWTIFREAVRRPGPGSPPAPRAKFTARFHLAGMSARANIPFSLLPMLFILGLPGFRSKIWLIQPDSGDFQGLYEWDSLADAQAYARSFAVRFMERRSLPGSASFQVEARSE